MKTVFYILLLLIATVSIGQGQESTPIALSFPDSLRIVMENTRNTDAGVVGGMLTTAWGNIDLDQQEKIKRQFRLMKRKGYKLRPHMVEYFGAIVNAVNLEGIDAAQLNNYLKVSEKVIQNYRIDKALSFFKTSRGFFEHHALFSDKGYRLYAKESEYTFEYIEFIPPPPDTLASLNDTATNTDTWTE